MMKNRAGITFGAYEGWVKWVPIISLLIFLGGCALAIGLPHRVEEALRPGREVHPRGGVAAVDRTTCAGAASGPPRSSPGVAMSEQQGEVDVEGGTVRYRVLGEGERTLVLLHGGPGAGSLYLKPLERLAGPDRRVVVYDQCYLETVDSFLRSV